MTIPNSVTTIGLQAFYSCNAATSIQIGSGVTTIAGSAFYNAVACNELRCLPTTPPSILLNTFTNLKSTC
ncbi:leucine-rich repeat protein, partial [Acinetobacter modestus]|uniref:leucine-rich repeat protein n=1 Tax=Acinetobacter modestus TaxID=1776740 RepID=UPI003AFAEF6B